MAEIYLDTFHLYFVVLLLYSSERVMLYSWRSSECQSFNRLNTLEAIGIIALCYLVSYHFIV